VPGKVTTSDPVVLKLIREKRDWAPYVLSCVKQSEEGDGTFWGSTVGNRAKLPNRNLTHLRALGILDRAEPGVPSGGSARYRMVNPAGAKQALIEAGYEPDARQEGDYFDQPRRARAA